MPAVRTGKRHWGAFLALGIAAFGLAACAAKLNGTPANSSSTSAKIAAAAAPHGLPVPGIPQSLGVHVHFATTSAQELQLLDHSGFALVRKNLTWTAVQPTTAPPNFKTSGYDSLVQNLKAAHIRPVLILSYCNPAFPSPATAAGRAAFAAYAADAAMNFRNDGVIWEIWNEPDGGFWNCTGEKGGAAANPESYVKLALATSAAIWKVDPSATIIGPASSTFNWAWFHQLATEGLLGALSGFSVHGYGANTPEEQAPNYAQLEAFLARHPVNGHPLPVVMSEWGWQTYTSLPKGWCCNFAVQADYVVRMMLDDLQSGVDFSVWYDLRDSVEGQGNWGVLSQNLATKPSYTAVQVLSSTLAGQDYVAADDVAACTPTEHAIRLSKGGEAFWAVSTAVIPTADVAGHFYVGSSQVTLVSQDGTRTQATATNGVLSASFQPSVTYVLGATGQLPPPAPAHVRFPSSLGTFMEDFYAREPAGTPASLMGSPPGTGTVALVWHPLCGVSAYRVLSGASANGPWHVQATTRKSIWIGAAPTSATWYTVESVSPAGVVGPFAPTLQSQG